MTETVAIADMSLAEVFLSKLRQIGCKTSLDDFGSGMSSNGILAAPVPSAAWGWDDAVRRFGKLSLKEIMQPAIEYAETRQYTEPLFVFGQIHQSITPATRITISAQR